MTNRKEIEQLIAKADSGTSRVDVILEAFNAAEIRGFEKAQHRILEILDEEGDHGIEKMTVPGLMTKIRALKSESK